MAPLLGNAAVQNVLVAFLALLITYALIRSAWRYQWYSRWPWLALAAGLVLATAGTTLQFLYSRPEDYPSWPILVWFLAYPGLYHGGYGILTARSARLDAIGVLDWALVMVAIVVFPGIPVLHRVLSTHAEGLSALGTATALAYPLLDIGLLGLVTWALTARSAANPILRWLAVALVLDVAADFISVWRGPSAQMPSWLLSIWLLAAGCAALAAMYAAPALSAPRARTHRAVDARWWVVAVLALFVPLLGLAWSLSSGRAHYTLASALGLVIIMVLIGARLAVAMARTRRHASRLSSLAFTDELTQLPNRRAILARLREVADSRMRPMAVAIIDLDHFKTFNDTYGHHGGDELLYAAAVAWREALGSAGVVGRLGGEEFLVVLPGSTAEQAQLILARMRRATPMEQTFSAGCTELPPDPELTAETLRRADIALYAAKSAGRARTNVVVAA